MKDKVVEAVCNDLKHRSSIGIKKYGKTLERDDYQLRDWLYHAYEETLDKANYLKAALMQNLNLLQITKSMFIELVQLLEGSPDRNDSWIRPEYTKNLHQIIELLGNTLDEHKWFWIKWWCYDNQFGSRGLEADINGKRIKSFDDLIKVLYE